MDDYTPKTERDKRQDLDARAEAAWWEERRDNAPNLVTVIQAAQARLEDADLSSEGRDRLEIALVGMSQRQRDRQEISESNRDSLLRQIAEL